MKNKQNAKKSSTETTNAALSANHAPAELDTTAAVADATIATGPTRRTPKAPKPVDPRTFTLANAEFKPGAGFAAALHAELTNKPGTVAEITDRLLASGAYQKVAPQAAKLRPAKPVATLLAQWLAKGAVTAA